MIACLLRDRAGDASPGDLIETIARACSPRVEPHGPDAVLFDADGLARVCGPPDVIAREVTALAASQSIAVRIALARTRTAAWILAHARAGATVVAPGQERTVLAPLPVGWLSGVIELDQGRLTAYGVRLTAGTGDNAGRPDDLGSVSFRRGRKGEGRGGGGHHFRLAPSFAALRAASEGQAPGAALRAAKAGQAPSAAALRAAKEGHAPGAALRAPKEGAKAGTSASALLAARTKAEAECREHLATFERWGLRTCGDVAALPRGDVHARMGPLGARLHQAACGEDESPLVSVDEIVPFVDRMQLEWPIEGLEPLSFVLSRQFDRLSSSLQQADRGAVAVITRLTLTTREVHERVLNLPAPMRDARVLRTLVLLDLESHPPSAGIDVVEIVLEVTPGRIVQGSLLERSLPSPEDVATLLARLGALMGESRIGAPVLLDTHDTREVAIKPFRVKDSGARLSALGSGLQEPPEPALHRLSLPLSVRVESERGVPVRLASSARRFSGAVVERAGPWRTSGAWWRLDAGGWDRDEWDVELDNGTVCRVARHRASGIWDIDGLFD